MITDRCRRPKKTSQAPRTIISQGDWRKRAATEAQIEYIKAIQAAGRTLGYYMPYIGYVNLSRGEASKYIEKYATVFDGYMPD